MYDAQQQAVITVHSTVEPGITVLSTAEPLVASPLVVSCVATTTTTAPVQQTYPPDDVLPPEPPDNVIEATCTEEGDAVARREEEGDAVARREEEGSARQRLIKGYILAALNVVLDVYGAVLTKQWGAALTPLDICGLRFGTASVGLGIGFGAARLYRKLQAMPLPDWGANEPELEPNPKLELPLSP